MIRKHADDMKVLKLRMKQKSFREIAEIMDRDVKVVYRRYKRAISSVQGVGSYPQKSGKKQLQGVGSLV